MQPPQNSVNLYKEYFIYARREDVAHFYDIDEKEIGRGAYGVVYKGREKQSGAIRAIKKINKKAIKKPEALISQLEILRIVDHPTCIRLYESFETEESLCLVTDLCQGGELFDRLQLQGSFNEEEARIIFKQMLEAVSYCHSHKIAHRDLKPENFMFVNSKSLSLKLIDFGLAYKWQTDMRLELIAKGEKRLVGTSYYIAPEIIAGKYTEMCDVWSSGVILYILLTGAPPFDGSNDKQILEHVKTMKYSFDIPEMELISADVKELIAKILVPEAKRITTKEIFKTPWVINQAPKTPIKLNFAKISNFTNYSKLKKITATFIATQISQEQLEQLGAQFKELDLNHDGEISIEELRVALSQEKVQPSVKELLRIMDSLDTDSNGRINFNEFVACSLDEKQFTDERLQSIFRKLDADNDGFVDREQLSLLLHAETNSMNGRSVSEILKFCDAEEKGKISYQNFKAHVLN